MKNFILRNEFIIIIVTFTLLRFIASAFMGLMPQDAYYTYYSENLALSYFDHPPMVAYMIWLFTFIFGKSLFVLHFADFTVTAATLILSYLFIKRIVPRDSVRRAMILLITAPFITILSINTTPDVPLLFFWALSLLLIHNAITKKSIMWWVAAGFAAGLAFDSKYTGVFLPAGLILFLILSKEHRRLLLSGRFILFLLSFSVAILPVVIWNIQNDFISIKYQSSERASDMSAFSFNPKLFAGYLGTQLGLALPLLFLTLFPASWRWTASIPSKLSGFFGKIRQKDNKSEQNHDFAASFALPMFILFTGIALIYWVKINWLMPVYISGAALVALSFRTDKYIRIQTILSFILHLALIAELIWMPVKVNSDDTWFGWNKLAAKTEEIGKKYPADFIFSDNSYKVSAALNFYMEKHVYAGNIVNEKAFQFALNDKDISSLVGKDAIYVTTGKFLKKKAKKGGPEALLAPYFNSVTKADSLILKNRSGQIERKFYFFICKQYKGSINQ